MTPKNFTKKPVQIEAWQLPVWGEPNNFGSERPSADNPVFDSVKYVNECIAIAEWCGGTSHMMCNVDEQAYSGCHQVGPHISIPTLEGVMAARPSDYVIRGVKGEFYPCKPDIFAATYDAVAS